MPYSNGKRIIAFAAAHSSLRRFGAASSVCAAIHPHQPTTAAIARNLHFLLLRQVCFIYGLNEKFKKINKIQNK